MYLLVLMLKQTPKKSLYLNCPQSITKRCINSVKILFKKFQDKYLDYGQIDYGLLLLELKGNTILP